MNNMATTRRKRMQVKCACEPCHQACKKCDDARPCTRCVRYGCEASCVDHTRKARQPGVKRGPYRRTPELAGSSGNNSDTNTGTGISNRGASSNDNNNSTIRSINTNNRNINNMAAFSIVAPTPGSSQARLHAMPRMVNDSISSIASSSVSSDEDMDARSHSSMSLSYSSSLSPSPVLNGYQRTATYVQNLQETKRHFNSNILHTPPLTMADFTSTPSPVHLTAPKAYPAQPLTLDVLAGIASRITNNIPSNSPIVSNRTLRYTKSNAFMPYSFRPNGYTLQSAHPLTPEGSPESALFRSFPSPVSATPSLPMCSSPMSDNNDKLPSINRLNLPRTDQAFLASQFSPGAKFSSPAFPLATKQIPNSSLYSLYYNNVNKIRPDQEQSPISNSVFFPPMFSFDRKPEIELEQKSVKSTHSFDILAAVCTNILEQEKSTSTVPQPASFLSQPSFVQQQPMLCDTIYSVATPMMIEE